MSRRNEAATRAGSSRSAAPRKVVYDSLPPTPTTASNAAADSALSSKRPGSPRAASPKRTAVPETPNESPSLASRISDILNEPLQEELSVADTSLRSENLSLLAGDDVEEEETSLMDDDDDQDADDDAEFGLPSAEIRRIRAEAAEHRRADEAGYVGPRRRAGRPRRGDPESDATPLAVVLAHVGRIVRASEPSAPSAALVDGIRRFKAEVDADFCEQNSLYESNALMSNRLARIKRTKLTYRADLIHAKKSIGEFRATIDEIQQRRAERAARQAPIDKLNLFFMQFEAVQLRAEELARENPALIVATAPGPAASFAPMIAVATQLTEHLSQLQATNAQLASCLN